MSDVEYLPLDGGEREAMTAAAQLMRLMPNERTRDLAHAIGTYEATVRAVEDERDALERFVVEAMHLAQYGERAPGGNETWAEWFTRAENYLRRDEVRR